MAATHVHSCVPYESSKKLGQKYFLECLYQSKLSKMRRNYQKLNPSHEFVGIRKKKSPGQIDSFENDQGNYVHIHDSRIYQFLSVLSLFIGSTEAHFPHIQCPAKSLYTHLTVHIYISQFSLI